MRKLILTCLLVSFVVPLYAQSIDILEAELQRLEPISGGTLGIAAIHLESGRSAFLNEDERFPMASTYKIPTIGEVPEAFQVRLLERAEQPDVIYGSKAVGEPPFMLALSVREALREAVASFGTALYVPLASPATPEAILRAIDGVRNEAEVADGSLITGD